MTDRRHHGPAEQEPTNPYPPLPVSQPLPTFPTDRAFIAPVGTPPPPPPPCMPFVERQQWSDIGVVDGLAVAQATLTQQLTHNDDTEENPA